MGCSSSKPVPSQADPRVRVQQAGPGGAAAAGSVAAAASGPPPRVKLVLLGDSGVGKSCLVSRYVRNTFDPNSKITVGAAFVSHNVSLPNGHTLKLEIWDTAGQERYLSLAPLYYRNAHAAAVVYSVTSNESFEKAHFWIGELQKNESSRPVMVLVGNKTDLSEAREVSEEAGRAFAESHNMLFVETSAKTAAGVGDVFLSVASQLAGGPLPVSRPGAA